MMDLMVYFRKIQTNQQYRASEEYTGSYIEEGIDTFAFGNNIYCLVRSLALLHQVRCLVL